MAVGSSATRSASTSACSVIPDIDAATAVTALEYGPGSAQVEQCRERPVRIPHLAQSERQGDPSLRPVGVHGEHPRQRDFAERNRPRSQTQVRSRSGSGHGRNRQVAEGVGQRQRLLEAALGFLIAARARRVHAFVVRAPGRSRIGRSAHGTPTAHAATALRHRRTARSTSGSTPSTSPSSPAPTARRVRRRRDGRSSPAPRPRRTVVRRTARTRASPSAQPVPDRSPSSSNRPDDTERRSSASSVSPERKATQA